MVGILIEFTLHSHWSVVSHFAPDWLKKNSMFAVIGLGHVARVLESSAKCQSALTYRGTGQ